MRNNNTTNYTSVSPSDPENGGDGQFPSSFMKNGTSNPRNHHGGRSSSSSTCNPRVLLVRPRLSLALLAGTFVLIGLISSAHLGYLHGHLGNFDLSFASSFLALSTEGNKIPPVRPRSDRVRIGLDKMITSGRTMTMTQWDVGSIHLNPFEYWMSRRDKHGYDLIMVNVEGKIRNPKGFDIPMTDVFTPTMFERLNNKMISLGWPDISTFWEKDYSQRPIISGFIQDLSIVHKGLIIEPESHTQKIRVLGEEWFRSRPAVTTMYEGLENEDMKDLNKWFHSWMNFMFDVPLKMAFPPPEVDVVGEDGTAAMLSPYQLLRPLNRDQYPVLSVEETTNSLPLQTLHLAMYDAIMAHLMNISSPPHDYEKIKRQIIDMLGIWKDDNTAIILQETYGDVDILTLQKISSKLLHIINEDWEEDDEEEGEEEVVVVQGDGGGEGEEAEATAESLKELYHIISPKIMDPYTDENSILLLRKSTFPNGITFDMTSLVEKHITDKDSLPMTDGDLLVVTANDIDDVPYVIVSFRADEDGRSTIPVMDAIIRTIDENDDFTDHVLLFGLEASTYSDGGFDGRKLRLHDFGSHIRSHGLTTCWGDEVQPDQYTVFKSKTFIQPRNDEACTSLNRTRVADQNQKDFILTWRDYFESRDTWTDNSNTHHYISKYPFPTLAFPSDHAAVGTTLVPRKLGVVVDGDGDGDDGEVSSPAAN